MQRLLLATLAFVALGVVPAAAQAPIAPADWCYEVDHSGDNPFGSPSAVRLYLTLPPELAGTWVDVSASGASGDLSGTGQVGSDGVVVIDLPLYSYGDHSVTAGVVDSGGANVAIDPTGLGFPIDSSEPVCDPSNLVLVAPQSTTTVTEATTTTTVAETTTTVVETTTTTVAETTTTTMAVTTAGDGGSSGWWIPLGIGTILIIGGFIVFRGNKAPCEEELAAWMAAQAECDDAQRVAEQAEQDCEEARGEVEDLEQQRKDTCKEWPPACWDSEDGGWIEESGKPGSRITQRDLHLRQEALGGVWDEYRSGERTAQEVEQAWKDADTQEFREEMRAKDEAARAKLEGIEARLEEARTTAREACDKAESARRKADEACDRAARAKAAYDACMQASATPEPAVPGPTTPEPPGGPTAPVAPGPGPSIAPPPEPPSSTPDDEPKEPVCCPEGVWMGYGWTTGGILGWGVESTIAHFICLCDTNKRITLASRSHRAGLALGGETSLFVAIMWGVPHTSEVPIVWASQSASGWDGDVSLGPSVSKGVKNVVKDAGLKQAGSYLKWAAKNKVPPSALDPRKLENLKNLAPDAAGTAMGTGRGLASQGTDPRLIVVPFGAGLQVGVWHKWCESVRVGDYSSCGCIPIAWP